MSGLEISCENLSCAISGVPIVEEVNITVPSGTSFAVIGPNGAGKSTLLRVLAGIRNPWKGRVLLNGNDLHKYSSRKRAQQITFIQQDEILPGDMLVSELVALGLTPYLNPWQRARKKQVDAVTTALEMVNLSHLAYRPLGQISGGERRRAVLARGLAQSSPILVLDEPTNHLDMAQQLALLHLLKNLGQTVIAAIHDLDMAATWFEQILILNDHKQLSLGKPSEVICDEYITPAFQLETVSVNNPRTKEEHYLFSSPKHRRI